MGSRVADKWVVAVLVGVTLLAIGRLCAGEFTWWHDGQTIHHNPRLNPPTWEGVGYYWTHPHMGLYVPVTYTAWSGLAAIGWVATPDERGISLNPYVFHAANVAVHVANVLIVYAILRRVAKREWAAGVGAMVFAVHPVQVEAVGWVSGMKDLLCGTFVLAAVWQYLKYAQSESDGKPARHYWFALGLTVVGTLCKPTAVVTPLVLVGVDRWVVGRDWKAVVRGVWPFVVAVVPCLVWAKVVQDVAPRGPVWSRPLVAMDAVAFYLGKLVWPGGMAVDYGRTPGKILENGAIWWTWVVTAVAAGVIWAGRRRWPVVVGAAVVFVAGMAPVLGLVPFMFQQYSTVADHYMYLPMLGVALAGAWVVERWPTRVTAAVAGFVLCPMVATSAMQAGVWHDDETLTRHGLAVNPQSVQMRVNLANTLDMRAEREGTNAGRAEAEALLREAMRIEPGSLLVRQSLAVVLLERGNQDEGIGLLRETIRMWEASPSHTGGRQEIATIRLTLAIALERQGRLEEAEVELGRALGEDPGNPGVRGELDRVRGRLRGLERAGDSSKVTRP